MFVFAIWRKRIYGGANSKVIEISGKNTAKEVVEEINNSMGDKNWSRPLLFIKIHKDKEKYMCIWCKVKTSVVLEIHNKIEMKRTVKYKLGKGFALNIRVKPFIL